MVITKSIKLETQGESDIIDITPDVKKCLRESKLKNGIACIFVPGSTGGLTTVEYESGVLNDLKNAFERQAPRRASYDHNTRWGDGNGFSHVRASLLGPSLSVPFSGGALTTGTWQQIIFVDFDNRMRSRTLVVQIVGEK